MRRQFGSAALQFEMSIFELPRIPLTRPDSILRSSHGAFASIIKYSHKCSSSLKQTLFMNGRCLPDRMQLFADAITDTENSKTYK
jgi:hypothetical protein